MTPEQFNRIALWNFPVGKVARIQVNVHWSLLFYALYLLYEFRHNAQLGLLAILILWGSIFLHELGHCFAARQQGGRADKVVLYILGGLAECEVEQRPWPQFVVAIWGPIVNVILAAIGIAILWPTLGFGSWILPWTAWPPLPDLGRNAVALLVRINLALALFNLIPAFPLDGGRVFHAALWHKQGFAKAMKTTIVLAFVCAAAIAIYALTVRETILFIVALFIVLGAYQQRRAMQMGLMAQGQDEPPWARSAQAYERAKGNRVEDYEDEDEDEDKPGAIARWKAERTRKKEEAESSRKLEVAKRLDEVLARVSEVGMQGLSEEERTFLNEASAEMREQREGP